MAQNDDKPFLGRGIRMSEIPRHPVLEYLVRFLKTFDVLFFKFLQVFDLYRPQKSIVVIPSLATRNYTLLQAVVYNGSQEEVLGFKPRRLLYRILKGLPDLEMFERVKFELAVTDTNIRSVDASSQGRGFIQLQLPWQLPYKPSRVVWPKVTPLGVETLVGTIRLGEYEVISAPVFFLTSQIKRIIVSDIDDTIKDSKVAETTNFRAIVASLFKGHYYTYSAIPGMAEIYQELASADTLFVYVTSTPFQLAPFLLKFLKEGKFPEGPVFTRWLGYGRFGHKIRSLTKVLTQAEGQKVYLIGDSGEQDLQVYRRIAENPLYADRIEKILIRHVPGSPIPSLKSGQEILYSKIEDLKQYF